MGSKPQASIADKPMAAQEGTASPYTKFGIDISMDHRDKASLPVWRSRRQWRLVNTKGWHELSLGQPTVCVDITISFQIKTYQKIIQKRMYW